MGMGIFFWVLAGIWKFAVVPPLTLRIPNDWHWSADLIGVSTLPDEQLGRFPDKDALGRYQRIIQVEPGSGRPHEVILVDRFIISNLRTGQTDWEYVYRAPVNPATGEHLTPEYHSQYFVFPRNVQKKTYVIRFSYLNGIPLTYRGESEIEGIRVYHFYYKGRGEYTASYQGTEKYPGISVEPGQEIRCADDQFVFETWVEPVTGEMVKIQESCYSGDYLFDTATGKAIRPVYRWAGITTSDDIIQRVEWIRAERSRILLVSLYLPLTIGFAGLISLILGPLNLKAIRARVYLKEI